MDYNTTKEHLVIREYGRNVQNLVNYALTVTDRDERTKVAKYIVELMAQVNPQYKHVDEYRRKLWDHLFYISGFKLDVDAPFPKPEPEDVIKTFKKEGRMPYPVHDIRFRHYGRNVENMVNKAVEMDDPEKQKAYTEAIGNYMKMAYANWNRENVTDEVIVSDIKRISKGKLSIDSNETDLDSLSKSSRSRRKPTNNNRGKGGKKKYKRRGRR